MLKWQIKAADRNFTPRHLFLGDWLNITARTMGHQYTRMFIQNNLRYTLSLHYITLTHMVLFCSLYDWLIGQSDPSNLTTAQITRMANLKGTDPEVRPTDTPSLLIGCPRTPNPSKNMLVCTRL